MNLINCEHCGVVLNKDVLNFPDDIYKEDGCTDPNLGIWDSDNRMYVPFVLCPVCKLPVT